MEEEKIVLNASGKLGMEILKIKEKNLFYP